MEIRNKYFSILLPFSTDDQQPKKEDKKKQPWQEANNKRNKLLHPITVPLIRNIMIKLKQWNRNYHNCKNWFKNRKKQFQKKNAELLSFQQQQQRQQEELPITTIDTNNNNSIDTKISGLPSNESDEFEKAQNPSVYIFCQHIEWVQLYTFHRCLFYNQESQKESK